MGPRIYTPREASALVPKLSRTFEDIDQIKTRLKTIKGKVDVLEMIWGDEVRVGLVGGGLGGPGVRGGGAGRWGAWLSCRVCTYWPGRCRSRITNTDGDLSTELEENQLI